MIMIGAVGPIVVALVASGAAPDAGASAPKPKPIAKPAARPIVDVLMPALYTTVTPAVHGEWLTAIRASLPAAEAEVAVVTVDKSGWPQRYRDAAANVESRWLLELKTLRLVMMLEKDVVLLMARRDDNKEAALLERDLYFAVSRYAVRLPGDPVVVLPPLEARPRAFYAGAWSLRSAGGWGGFGAPQGLWPTLPVAEARALAGEPLLDAETAALAAPAAKESLTFRVVATFTNPDHSIDKGRERAVLASRPEDNVGVAAAPARVAYFTALLSDLVVIAEPGSRPSIGVIDLDRSVSAPSPGSAFHAALARALGADALATALGSFGVVPAREHWSEARFRWAATFPAQVAQGKSALVLAVMKPEDQPAGRQGRDLWFLFERSAVRMPSDRQPVLPPLAARPLLDLDRARLSSRIVSSGDAEGLAKLAERVPVPELHDVLRWPTWDDKSPAAVLVGRLQTLEALRSVRARYVASFLHMDGLTEMAVVQIAVADNQGRERCPERDVYLAVPRGDISAAPDSPTPLPLFDAAAEAARIAEAQEAWLQEKQRKLAASMPKAAPTILDREKTWDDSVVPMRTEIGRRFGVKRFSTDHTFVRGQKSNTTVERGSANIFIVDPTGSMRSACFRLSIGFSYDTGMQCRDVAQNGTFRAAFFGVDALPRGTYDVEFEFFGAVRAHVFIW